ncbi:VTT domain-containing protein [Streptomyces sp. NPDC005840]|uniref:DedA family protein n=1 Tax=Streptomyces sp. NPDC005840 TaxID=3157072 RepID=UPI0033DB3901
MTRMSGYDEAAPSVAPEGAEESAPNEKGRRTWWGRTYSPEEIEAAQQQWRDLRPWGSPMARADKVLIGVLIAAVLLSLVSLPLRPFLLESHPIATAAATGSSSAIGAGAAFAKLGQGELWWVIVAGVIGKIKFDWLYWWAGRRWGEKGMAFFVPTDRAKRLVPRLRSWPAVGKFSLVVAASLPGVPAIFVFLLAGLSGMSLPAFLLADALGAALMTGLVAGLGYGLGQNAVDVVLLIDNYALWIVVAFSVLIGIQASRAQVAWQKKQRTAAQDRSGDHQQA